MSTELGEKPVKKIWYQAKIDELQAEIEALKAGALVEQKPVPQNPATSNPIQWVYDPEDAGKGHPGDKDEDGQTIAFLTPLHKHSEGLRPLFKRGVTKSEDHFEFAEEYRFADRMSYDPTNLPNIARAMLDRAFKAAGLRDAQDPNATIGNFPAFDQARTIRLTIRVE